MLDARLTIGSLFAGIGGLELGLEWAGVGPVLWQVERDEFCRRVLERHWPSVDRFDDVRTVGTVELAPVELICGGFPCQDVSSAGARAGLAGSRSGLWSEFARIVAAMRPRWVVVENVTSGAKLWVDAVQRELGGLGYETLPVPMRADSLGAPHPRARIFIVARRVGLADPDGDGKPSQPEHAEMACAPAPAGVVGSARQAADAHGEQLWEQSRGKRGAHGEGPAVPVVDRWSEPMPAVDRVVSGSPGRVAAQRAGGNCVVPQCARVVGEVINILRGA